MYTVGYISLCAFMFSVLGYTHTPTNVTEYLWGSENHSEDKSHLSSYHVGPDDQTLVFSLGDK